jgi:peptidylprolyl isomerase
MNRRLPRVASAILVSAALLGGLSACYVGPAKSECTPQAKSGDSSQSVTAQGALLTEPTVSFPTPLIPDSTQATTLKRGDGRVIAGDQYASAFLSIYNGATGALLDQSDYASGTPSTFVIDKLPFKGLKQGLQCAQVGSRVAVVVPSDEAFSDSQRPAGVSAKDSLVVVVDFKDAFLSRAQGTEQVAQNGLPAVVLAPDGRPGITVPADAPPPKKLQVANTIIGNGATVKEGDSVLVNYTGVLWKDGTVFESSWDKGAPVTLDIAKGKSIPGFVTGIKGKKVGDQVLLVIPPDQAYGAQGNGTVPGNATLVFVVDILGIVK